MIGLSTLICAGLSLYFYHINNRRAAGIEDYKFDGLDEEGTEELGDESPNFRYMI
jgi:hypothetical protein